MQSGFEESGGSVDADVLRAFGMRGRVEEIRGGLESRMWRVRSQGGDYALKSHPPRAAEAKAARSVDASHVLAAHRIPVAEPVPTTDGRPTLATGSSVYSAARWIDGSPADRLPGGSLGPEQLGAWLARIHLALRDLPTGDAGARRPADRAEALRALERVHLP